ncbi:filamentous hemagglutinin outer membrane protein [Stanieria cyanosphaera PCC 7437]|uniref:Filamentous hemagglutinin outer membrane protein n=1 Tax=Stanieria cyanosphaera (strain ATCC 29371 / PCC 7437) TaxID=111780 RepID=K9XRP5_STAC7|nr:CHAT domain-containing protein [Stanieria cyanosphaera]AFZ34754.1 filamentous hemagglutinin outer membrane protein [Stanieria cyanosphaera PCC 7437]
MKLSHLILQISLISSSIIVLADSVLPQTGNMSDITGPNPVEVIPNQPSSTDNTTVVEQEPNVETPTTQTPTQPEVVETPATETSTQPEVVENPATTETPTQPEVVETPTTQTPTQPEVVETPATTETPTQPEVVETPTTQTPTQPEVVETPATTETPTQPEVVETPTTQTPTQPEVVENPATETSTQPEVVENPATETPTQPEVVETPATETPTQPEVVENPATTETPTQPEVVENPATTETPTQPEVVENPATTETPTQPNIKSPGNSNQDNLADTDEENLTSDIDSKTETNTTERSNQSLTQKEESETSAETEEVAEQEKKPEEKSENNQKQSDFEGEIDRLAYEVQVQQSTPEIAIQLQEELQATQLVGYSGTQLYGQTPSVQEISQRLGQLWQQTGKKAAFINISVQSNQLEAFAVLPSLPESASNPNSETASNKNNSNKWSQPRQPLALRRTVHDTSRQTVLDTAKKFRSEIGNSRKINQTNYLKTSQQLYQWLIAPLEAELKANQVDVLVFSMDSGLRLIPIAALYDGKQFLIEKYAVALVPSFGLTDTRYVDVSQSPILAMGASKFKDQFPLPTMPIELQNVISNPRQGELFLNEQFTVNNFKTQNLRARPFRIIHLGTHAEFLAGEFQDSYIQFYDQKLKLPQLREISDELGWNTTQSAPVELLVLSACQTAIGNEKAELGFAGLAVQAGVKSTLASLWYVSDLGTLALMSEFYDELSDSLIKAEALRQTQLKMLKGQVVVDNGKLQLSNGNSLELPAEFPKGNLSFSHPYFWSSFTLVGNWN